MFSLINPETSCILKQAIQFVIIHPNDAVDAALLHDVIRIAEGYSQTLKKVLDLHLLKSVSLHREHLLKVRRPFTIYANQLLGCLIL